MHTMRQRYIVASLWFLLFFFVGEVSAEYAPSVRQNQDRVSSNTQSLLFQSQQIMSPVSSYEGRVYSPFSNSTPSMETSAEASSSQKHPGHVRKELGHGSDAGNQSTSFPIGEPWIMGVLAMMMVGWRAIKRRKGIGDWHHKVS